MDCITVAYSSFCKKSALYTWGLQAQANAIGHNPQKRQKQVMCFDLCKQAALWDRCSNYSLTSNHSNGHFACSTKQNQSTN